MSRSIPSAFHNLPNFGRRSAAILRRAGITTVEQLQKVGPVQARLEFHSARAAPTKAFASAAAIVTLAGCMGLVPGRQAHWDAHVKQMCESDGGVTVYESVLLSEAEYRRLAGRDGTISVPPRESASKDTPYVADKTITMIRKGDPEVFRIVTNIVRLADGRVLSRMVQYARTGADAPLSRAHHSSYDCRQAGVRMDVERQTFQVLGSDTR